MSDRVVIIGPGRMGLALGAALVQSGAAERLTYIGRAPEPPPHPLFEAGAGAAGYLAGMHGPPQDSTALFLAVPDQSLAEVARDVASAGPAPSGCAAFHLAGALSTDVLAPLSAVGYAVGSFHPFQTVADAWAAGDRLMGAAVAIAGEPAAMAVARRLVIALGGRPLIIPPLLRPNYHAAAVFGSNYLVTLAALTVRLLERAGVDPGDAGPAALLLLRGALENLEHLGVGAALTGPIARGDVDTVRLHLSRLSYPERALYCALGRETLHLARAAGLDESRAAELESILSPD